MSTIFKIQSKHYAINNQELKKARIRRAMTVREFAEKCGWSPAYQWKLETVTTIVNEETKNIIECVLKLS